MKLIIAILVVLSAGNAFAGSSKHTCNIAYMAKAESPLYTEAKYQKEIEEGGNINGTCVVEEFGTNVVKLPPPLFVAIKEYNYEAVKILLKLGANPNLQYNDSNKQWLVPTTVLMYALQASSRISARGPWEKKFENGTKIIQALLDQGADPTVNIVSTNGPQVTLRTVDMAVEVCNASIYLFIAEKNQLSPSDLSSHFKIATVQCKNLEMTQYLVSKRGFVPGPTALNDYLRSFTSYGSTFDKGAADVGKYLLSLGQNINEPTFGYPMVNTLFPMIHNLIRHPYGYNFQEITNFFIENGLNINAKHEGTTAVLYALMTAAYADKYYGNHDEQEGPVNALWLTGRLIKAGADTSGLICIDGHGYSLTAVFETLVARIDEINKRRFNHYAVEISSAVADLKPLIEASGVKYDVRPCQGL